MAWRWLAGVFLAGLTACALPPAPTPTAAPTTGPTPAAKLVLNPIPFDFLPGWQHDSHADALIALRRSCARRAPGGIAGGAAHWRPICAEAAGVGDNDHATARRFFEKWFIPYLATDNRNAQGLFTGYYEAELHGSRKRHGPFQVPLYLRPPDLVTVDLGKFRADWKGKRIAGRVRDGRLTPFESRTAIDKGALDGRGLELMWVDDPVDAFFLHIQGSGRVRMDDGGTIRVGYAGHNGHRYVAIGKELIARGQIARKAMSMQAIRAWLQGHPIEGAALMATNPAFIFFRKIDGAGPIGAQGVALTPGRSLAVDRRFVPLGLPLWLDTTDPLDPRQPLRRLVIAQDTGGAIKGPVRGDLFWGFGDAAAQRAGHMKQTGQYYLLLPRGVAPPPR
jgi:membrane-bound lytic murein transglycosylase A